MKTEDLEAVSDGVLSEELEDVSEDEELECFKKSLVIFSFKIKNLISNNLIFNASCPARSLYEICVQLHARL